MAAVAVLMMPLALAMVPPPANAAGAVSFTACAEISPRGQQFITSIAQALTLPQMSGRRAMVVGHAEAMGDKDKELAASRVRAQQVMRALALRGVAVSRMATKAMGASEPLDDILPQDAENCRVEVQLID